MWDPGAKRQRRDSSEASLSPAGQPEIPAPGTGNSCLRLKLQEPPSCRMVWMQMGELSLGPLGEGLGKQLHLLKVSTPVLLRGAG